MRTVGFDFGTHQTKVCVENREGAELQYEFFKFKDAKGIEQYTLPSILSVDKKGLVRYGYLSDEISNNRGLLQYKVAGFKTIRFDGKIVRYFKQATFTKTCNDMSKMDAVYYSIWYISYILFDLEAIYGQDFAIQMGVPTDGERLNSQKQLVVRLLLSAYRLVEEVFKNDKDTFLRTPIQQLKEKTVFIPYSEDMKEEYNILVFPEAYACLMPLIKQSKIASGMSLMIDIGGGTTDISFFTINVENNTPQVYRLFSIDKGLNYLTDAMSTNRKRLSSNIESASEILKDRRCSFEKEIESVCRKLNNHLAQEFKKQSKLPISRLTDALKARPVLYTGGGSTFDILRIAYLGFKDIIHISEKEWRSECVVDINRISSLGLCPILSTSYGLSISMTSDDIKCEPFRDIFKNLRDIEEEKNGGKYQYGQVYGGFDYADDWDAWK